MYLSSRALARSLAHSLARAFLSFSTATFSSSSFSSSSFSSSFSSSSSSAAATPPPRRHLALTGGGTAERHDVLCRVPSTHCLPLHLLSLLRVSTVLLLPSFFYLLFVRLPFRALPSSHTCDATHNTTVYTHVRTSLHDQLPRPVAVALRINSRSFLLFLRFALFGSYYLCLPAYLSPCAFPSRQSPPHTDPRPTPSNRFFALSHRLLH